MTSGPDYKTHDPKGWGGDPSRGAALGRPTVKDEGKDFQGRISIRRVRLDSGGYDKNGMYFGHGAPLYWCASEDGGIDFMLRAGDREAAREKVLKDYPKARIKP
jgi:hypothetical protein